VVEWGEVLHDFAGLVMMPVAVSIIFGEIWLLDRIVKRDKQGSTAGQGMVVVRSQESCRRVSEPDAEDERLRDLPGPTRGK